MGTLTTAHPLIIQQGDDRPLTWTLTDSVTGARPTSLEGYTARAQVRERRDATTVLHEWSTEAGTADISAEDATVSLDVADSESWTWTRGVYDLTITDFAGRTEYVDRGPVVVIPAVTR